MENNLTISTKSSNVTLNTNRTLHEMLEVLKNSDKLQEIQDYILSITPKSNSITPLIREDLVEKTSSTLFHILIFLKFKSIK